MKVTSTVSEERGQVVTPASTLTEYVKQEEFDRLFEYCFDTPLPKGEWILKKLT
jgi:hypothetical protein